MEAIYAGIALTGPTASEHSGPVEFPWTIAIEIAPLVGASAPFIGSYGNEQCMVTFGCIRRYASILAAMEARATFIKSLPATGQLELSQFAGGQTLYLIGAAWKAPMPAPVLMGRAVAFTFTFAVKTLTASYSEENIITDQDGEAILDENNEPITE